MKQAWKRLGTPDAISWVSALIISVQLMGGSLAAPYVDTSGRLPEFMLARVGSIAALLSVLGIGKLALNRFARTRPRPLLTVAIFLIAMVVVSASMNWLLIILGFTNTWNVPQRLIVALPGVFAILTASAVLIARARELSIKNSELRAQSNALATTKRETAQRVRNRQTQLVESVRLQLENSLGELKPQGLPQTAEGLKNLIDDVIRPMSYRLDREIQPHTLEDLEVSAGQISWSSVVHESVRGNPSHPVAITLWLGTLMGTFLISSLGLNGLLALAPLVLTVFGVLYITRILWRFLPATWTDGMRAALFTAIILIYTLLSMAVSMPIIGRSFWPLQAFIGWAVVSLFISWATTAMFAVTAKLRSLNNELTATVEDLHREVVNLNNQLRHVQKQASRVLHGPVQEAVTASLIRLSTSTGKARKSFSLDTLTERVAAALDMIGNPVQEGTQLDRSLKDLVELWDEVVDIRIEMSPSAIARIHTDPVASSAFIELLREALGNAIRHGEAKLILVSARVLETASTIELTVTNDGRPLALALHNGLGTQMFDDMCLSWSRDQVGPHVRVEARIPLSS